MAKEKDEQKEHRRREDPEPIVIYGHLGEGRDAIRLSIHPGQNECHWDLSYGIHMQTKKGDRWTPILKEETFSSIEPCDIIRIKDSIGGFETDMARTVGQFQADWTAWKTAFTSLREQLNARIAN